MAQAVVYSRTMARLIVPITSSTKEQVLTDCCRARECGADMVELRLDYLPPLRHEDLAAIRRAAPDLQLLVTPRSPREGGVWEADDSTRIDRLRQVVEGADAIDLELDTWVRSQDLLETEIRPHCASRFLILSAHDFQGRPRDLARLIERMNTMEECQVVKVAFTARHISECFELFDLMYANIKPVIAVAMGDAGVITRILAKRFPRSFGTFASLERGRESAPGQLTIDELKRLYRWDALSLETAVYGVIGYPVGHSMSPAIHNPAFEAAGLDAVYVPLLIEPTYEHFEDFLREALARPWFGLAGCSVTIPHKANALKFARQRQAEIEPLAERIGAVNTLTFRDGRVRAHNTDYAGALDALTAGMGCSRSDLAGIEVAVLGAGGAARGIVAGLRDCGARVTIYNRTLERARELADEFDCKAAPLTEAVRAGTKVIINATSIGMHPHVEASPLAADRLRPDMTVFDTVYNPLSTKLLREAGQVGCRTVDGVCMFVNQAAAQFEIWTGLRAPRDLMRQAVLARLA